MIARDRSRTYAKIAATACPQPAQTVTERVVLKPEWGRPESHKLFRELQRGKQLYACAVLSAPLGTADGCAAAQTLEGPWPGLDRGSSQCVLTPDTVE